MKINHPILFIVLLLLISYPYSPQAGQKGIWNQQAPEWQLNHWIQPAGINESFSLHDLKGKVVYLYFFQAQCPGCIEYGFPSLKILTEQYKENENVAFVAVQTVFENFEINTPAEAKKVIKQFDLNIPVAHDAGEDHGSALMKSYNTGGTPWVIIIDAKGIVRFNDFHIQPDEAVQLMNSLLEEAGSINSRIGEPFQSISELHWLHEDQKPFTFADSKLTLIRWWTDGCPFCIQSIPALQELCSRYSKQEIRFATVYHHKPFPKKVDDAQLAALSHLVGARDLTAVDEKWNALQTEWLQLGNRSATSVTFLVDQAGTIRYVHPGMRIFRSTNPIYRQANQDMMELEKTVEKLLNATQK